MSVVRGAATGVIGSNAGTGKAGVLSVVRGAATGVIGSNAGTGKAGVLREGG